MTLSAETEVATRTDYRKSKGERPVRTKLWFSIVAVLLALLVGVFWGFNQFRNHMIAQFFAHMKMPPVSVSVAKVKSEVLPNLLTGIGDVVAVHQVNVTTDVAGRVVKIMFEPGAHVVEGQPIVQLFDDPDRGDLANFQAQALAAKLALDRAKALALRQFGPQATVDDSQATYDQAQANIAKTKALISQKLILAPFSGELGLRHIELGQFLNAGSEIVTLTDLSQVWVNFTVTEKNSAKLKLGQTVHVSVDAYPGRVFVGKITTVEPQISTDTRNISVQATFDNPDHALKPGMFANATIVLPDRPPVLTVPETAADYSLYGDSVFLIKKSTGSDGKEALTAVRTFVKTGERLDGRVVIASSNIKPGDDVVAVGQIKLQSGAAVAISSEPPPVIPAEPSPY
ncbi:efflux transporter periplasmic adaptor subunit [Methylovirgula ligni]|uniref:Multidrug efflux system membrane fusion protein n=1 Tax=Methylovirgula ligni TaxID=569860 RepID=A0A3D9YYV3_9HYPH|nr:efflux RND transporter periplasmic adaptor subunit [Methylovirgula ligni]QAY94587.1 efflux transporter periplasmic adaptor subunit [Methylovirgula ligni]REF87545.1 multidrug efflux system membrane fusion protein [Methylovirgula ligni]